MVNQLVDALLKSDINEVKRILFDGNEQMFEKIVVPAMERIGELWEEGEVALSQIYTSGIIIEEIADEVFKPRETNSVNSEKMGICVLEDYHFLGKRIVYSTLKSAGKNITDFHRKNVDEIVQKTLDDNIDILLISTLMLPSALKIKTVVEKLKERRSEVKIVVGGAPFRFDDQLWKEVGADAMCYNASDIFKTVDKLSSGAAL